MAYVSAEMTKAVRKALKEQMPGWKIRVAKNAHSSTIYMTIEESPKEIDLGLEFLDDTCRADGYMEVNHYFMEQYIFHEHYKKIIDIMREATASVGHPFYDKSDIQSDYFNTAYYYYLRIGSYEKPYIKAE